MVTLRNTREGRKIPMKGVRRQANRAVAAGMDLGVFASTTQTLKGILSYIPIVALALSVFALGVTVYQGLLRQYRGFDIDSRQGLEYMVMHPKRQSKKQTALSIALSGLGLCLAVPAFLLLFKAGAMTVLPVISMISSLVGVVSAVRSGWQSQKRIRSLRALQANTLKWLKDLPEGSRLFHHKVGVLQQVTRELSQVKHERNTQMHLVIYGVASAIGFGLLMTMPPAGLMVLGITLLTSLVHGVVRFAYNRRVKVPEKKREAKNWKRTLQKLDRVRTFKPLRQKKCLRWHFVQRLSFFSRLKGDRKQGVPRLRFPKPVMM